MAASVRTGTTATPTPALRSPVSQSSPTSAETPHQAAYRLLTFEWRHPTATSLW